MGFVSQPPPTNPFVGGQASLAFYGDSITGRGYSVSGNFIFRNLVGYTTWVNILTRQRFYSPDTLNFGVSGDTTTQMVARLGAVLAARPTICVVHGGTNDGFADFAGTTANLTTIYNALAAIGCIIIAIPILGRGGTFALTSTQQFVGLRINQWIKTQRNTRSGFYVADCGTVFDDPSSAAWNNRTGYTDLGLHPIQTGAQPIGQKVADILNVIYPDWYIPAGNPTDLYDATNNPTGNQLSGGMFIGTGGTTNSPATGNTATGWTLVASSLLGATCAASKSTLTDGRVAQQLDLSGTYTGATGFLQLQHAATAANFAAGDIVEASVEVSIGTNTNIAAIDLWLQSTESAVQYQHHSANFDNTFTLQTAGFSGILRTPPRTITATPSSVVAVIKIPFFTPGSSTAIAATIKLASCSVRKL